MERTDTRAHRFFEGGEVPDVSWVVAARVAVLGAILLSSSFTTFFFGPEAAARVEFIYYPVSFLFAYCALSAVWLRFHKPGKGFLLTQFASDILIVTGVIYISGGPVSPFLFLYLPLVMAASIFVSRNAALFAAAACGVTYSLLVWAMMNGLLTPADGSVVVQTPTAGVLLQCIGLSSAMILIAVATSFLTKKLNLTHILAEQSKQEMIEMTARQQKLFEGLPEGIISTNEEREVLNMNRAARRLLGIGPEIDVKGSELEKLILSHFEDYEFDANSGLHSDKGEISLFSQKSGESPLRLKFHCRPLGSDEGNLGFIYFFQDVTRLRSVEEQLAMQERMARLLADTGEDLAPSPTKLAEFVGETTVMKKVFALIEKVSHSDATVLINGESGTGKELVAKAIHLGGPRSAGKFIPVNCGAIPDNLVESELFGHKKGAFTGADSDHVGMFREADGGTIFLDEIGELPLQVQAKLLRALQEKCVRPVGSETTIPIDARIIAATNKNLKEESEKGNFREDLFYRLNVININLPPLRERRGDIPLLVNSILRRLLEQEVVPAIAPAVMQNLMDYHYPGNVRELENILERAVVFGGEGILLEHLPDYVTAVSSAASSRSLEREETQIIIDENLEFPIQLDEFLQKLERRYLEDALRQTNGAKKKAADLLGMNFRSFRYRLQKFGIDCE